MNKDIQEQWVTALLSGEFQQGQERLRTSETVTGVRHCCLGVLCELHARAGLGHWTGNTYVVNASGDTTISYPPMAVVAWAGMSGYNPAAEDCEPLAEMNDNGKTFEEIAQHIREHGHEL